MKKILVSALIVLAAVPQALAIDIGFSDVPQSHPNYIAITYLNTQGVVKGYEDGTFKPDQLVNRAEALKILLVGSAIKINEVADIVSFSDIKTTDWFTKYIETAKSLGYVSGNPDGTFAPGRNVSRAEYLKMLLNINGFKPDNWTGQALFSDVPVDAWFAPYMNYAGQAGLLTPDSGNNLLPGKEATRAEVAEIFYLLAVIRKGEDTQFLLSQAEAQMAQVEIYIDAGAPLLAKRAAELSVDMTQQAYKNLPDNNVVLGAAKLARAYDFLVNASIAASQQKTAEAADWANQAIAKATEAWEANNDLQTISRHIKDRANEILSQLGVATQQI